MSNKSIGLGEILMKIMSANDRLLFREKLRNQRITGTVQVTGHAAGQSALIGVSHG
jgi:hypothetical protein